ncbi:hypothetical protein WJX74_008646 [Apatococcus lobatus]|uniref:Uncharacterized protein n=1 Tax=Apatococcus lobatus TaxID=904363 RepID=A0AAW1SF65_9CHLO
MSAQYGESLQEALQQSEAFLASLHDLSHGFSKERQPCLQVYVATYHELAARLVRRSSEHPASLNLAMTEQTAYEVVCTRAEQMLLEASPSYRLLQDYPAFQQKTMVLLARLHQLWAPFSLEYTHHLMRPYMTLLCNLARLQFLMASVPRQLVIQMYSLLHSIVHQGQAPLLEDQAANRIALMNCDCSPERVMPSLQTLMRPIEPRVTQVLNQILYPVLRLYHGVDSLKDSRLLELGPITEHFSSKASPEQNASSTAEGWQMLAWLPLFETWALWCLLLFPGLATQAEGTSLLQKLLGNSMRLQIYRERSEWVHHLYELHVKPALVLTFHASRAVGPSEDREALSHSAKDLIESSRRVALANCMENHQLMRLYLQQRLEDLVNFCAIEPSRVAALLQQLLGALELARGEITWYFCHFDEIVPKNPVQALVDTSQPLRSGSMDLSVPGLIAAMQRTRSICLQFRSAVAAFAADSIRQAVDQDLSPALMRMASQTANTETDEDGLTFGHILRRMSKGLTSISRHTLQLQDPEQKPCPFLPEDLRKLQSGWMMFIAAIFSSHATPSAAELEDSGSYPGLLCAFAQLVDLAEVAVSFPIVLQRASSLKELVFWPGKMLAGMKATIKGPSTAAANACAWLYPIADSDDNVLPGQHDSCSPTSIRLAESLVRQASQHAVHLLAKILKMQGSLGLQAAAAHLQTVGEDAPAHSMGLRAAWSAPRLPMLSQPVPQSWPMPISGQESRPDAEGVSFEGNLQSVHALLRSLSTAAPVRVSPVQTILPAEHLAAAIIAFLCGQIQQSAVAGEDLQIPSLLRRDVVHLSAFMIQLQAPLGNLGAGTLMKDAMMSLCASEAVATTAAQGTGTNQSLLSFVVAWYTDVAARDVRNLGVSIATSKQRLYSSLSVKEGGVDIAQYTNITELEALVAVFGLDGARLLAASLEEPLKEAVWGLHDVMTAHEPMLAHLQMQLQAYPGDWAACAQAAEGLSDLDAVLSSLKLAARCLLLRELLSLACQKLMQPACERKGLPSAWDHSLQALGLPVFLCSRGSGLQAEGTADPALCHMMTGVGKGRKETIERWSYWPLLMGLAFWSPMWSSATYVPAHDNLSNNMGCFSICARAFAAALPVLQQTLSLPQVAPAASAKLLLACAEASMSGRQDHVAGKLLALNDLTAALSCTWPGHASSAAYLQVCHLQACLCTAA